MTVTAIQIGLDPDVIDRPDDIRRRWYPTSGAVAR
jgi:hypothetical protein